MRRAIKDLCQLSDDRLFREISEGISCVVDHVRHLDDAANKLNADGARPAADIMELLAAEEAAKAFVLLDAVRCPRARSAEMSRTLGYFYDHVAKGVYALACEWHPVNFAEVTRAVKDERAPYYLDGPNDIDWVFPNSIAQERNDRLYVGYVEADSENAGHGRRYWSNPQDWWALGPFWTRTAVRVACALDAVGATTSEGLAVVAEAWRGFVPALETSKDELEGANWRMFEMLNEHGLLLTADADAMNLVCERLPFPLWPLELGPLEKKDRKKLLRTLREEQARRMGTSP